MGSKSQTQLSDFHFQVNLVWGSVQFSHSVMSNSLWPHGLRHTRLRLTSLRLDTFFSLQPQFSNLKSEVVGFCYVYKITSASNIQWCNDFSFISIINLYRHSEMKVTQLFLTLWGPKDCSLPDSSVHGILQERILAWVAIPFSRGSSWLRDQTWFFCFACVFFTI